jgi:hypothetical protein
MKQAFTILILFAFLPFYSAAQQWAAPGTEWNFVQKIIFGGEIIPTKIKVTDQFLLNGFLVSELKIENQLGCGLVGSEILTYSTPDGKVYFKEPSDPNFKILYDFQAQVGESWSIPFTTGSQQTMVTYTVENISIVDVEGSPRKQLECRVTMANQLIWSHPDENAYIVEGVGDLLYLFPWQTSHCDEGVMVGLCNYSDDEIETYRPYPNIECVASVSVNEIVDLDFFEVSPNPASNILNIMVPVSAPAIVPFSIFNMQGKLIHQGQLNNISVSQLSVVGWPSGLYFIKSNLGERIQVSKFIKQ